MNYANLIEDAKLKKTFIVATLVSTVIGTFQAATTLHDKFEEKREKKANQAKLDSKQNKALKELQDKLKQLEENDKKDANGGNGEQDGNDGKNEDDDKKSRRARSSSRSRSRSRSRRRRRRSRESWEDNQYFAESARRSQAMIERTYHDHLQRLGPAYAQGDMITENALQAQTIRLQQTVIGILQEAANSGRGLSRDDLDRLIAAQNTARDGSLQALQGQYDRIAYGKPASNVLRAAPPIEVATYQHEPTRLEIEPAISPSRRTSVNVVREPAAPVLPVVVETSRRSSMAPPPPPPPPSVQREFARLALGPPPGGGSHRSSKRSPSPRAVATIDAKVTPTDADRVREHQERRSRAGSRTQSRAGSPPSRRKSTSLVTHAPKVPIPERKVSSLVNSAPSLMDKRGAVSSIAKTTATQVDGKTAAQISRAPSKAGSRKPSPIRNSTSMVAQAPKTSAPNPERKLKQDLAPAVQKPQPLKTLPTAPFELFCPYSTSLQNSTVPLSSSFRPSGSHRCPSCNIRIPVDTRDVWVLSTHFRQKVREYRMDSRFVVKCHSPEGGFACVLCDRFRDMDCLCRSVDALVKHLGTAHTPEEFERDGDLVRMRPESEGGVGLGGGRWFLCEEVQFLLVGY